MRSASRGSLGDREWKVYEFIAKNFLGSISSDATYLAVEAVFTVGREEFVMTGTKLIKEGFLRIMKWLSEGDVSLPKLKPGEELPLKGIRIVEGETAPPGFLPMRHRKINLAHNKQNENKWIVMYLFLLSMSQNKRRFSHYSLCMQCVYFIVNSNVFY